MVVVTHSGKFHADDAWAVAVLFILFPDSELVRTRDPAIIEGGRLRDRRRRHPRPGQRPLRPPPEGLRHRTPERRALRQRGPGLARIRRALRRRAGTRAHRPDAERGCLPADGLRDRRRHRAIPRPVGRGRGQERARRLWPVGGRLRLQPELDGRAALGYGEAADAYRLAQFRKAMALLTDIMVNSVKYRVGALLALEQVRGAEVLETASCCS
jgi:hypothetical protein